jgi:tRNA wybutosine-synthesizing protein 4
MCGTLKKRNSPLLGVGDFPTAEAQAQRYRSLGFTHSYALTTLSCYEDVLSNEERFRVELLEEYDEFEEWVVKCSHYTTVMGSQDGVYGGAFFDSIYSDFPKFGRLG